MKELLLSGAVGSIFGGIIGAIIGAIIVEMKLNFYEKYLQKNLEIELEKLDLITIKDLLTKKNLDSSYIKGVHLLFKKDIFYILASYVFIVGALCGIFMAIEFALKNHFLSYVFSLCLIGFVLSILYYGYIQYQRNKIITRMLEKKFLDIKKDIFRYKKINSIFTKKIVQ